MKPLTKAQYRWVDDHTYLTKYGTAFLFWEDIRTYLGKRKTGAFEKFMVGSTQMLLPNGDGAVYVADFMCFLRGNKINPD